MIEDEARTMRRRSLAGAAAALCYARRHRAQDRPDLVALAMEDLQRCRRETRAANMLIASSDDPANGGQLPHH